MDQSLVDVVVLAFVGEGHIIRAGDARLVVLTTVVVVVVVVVRGPYNITKAKLGFKFIMTTTRRKRCETRRFCIIMVMVMVWFSDVVDRINNMTCVVL